MQPDHLKPTIMTGDRVRICRFPASSHNAPLPVRLADTQVDVPLLILEGIHIQIIGQFCVKPST